MLGFNAIGLDGVAMSGLSLSGTAPPTEQVVDTTEPTMNGTITVTPTTSGGTASWPAASDNVGVAGYEASVDSGTPSWVNVGLSTTYSFSGKSAGTSYTFRVRAYDDAGLRAAPITKQFTTLPVQTGPSSVTVPAVRTAKFIGHSRLVVFSGTKRVIYPKGPLDELYIIADISADLLEASTTAAAVEYVASGVAVLEDPVPQNGLAVVKLGAYDMSQQQWSFTFRFTLANGEQVDHTIEFRLPDDLVIVFRKDPDDKRLYTLDFGADATFGGTALQSVETPVVADLAALTQPALQGNAATVMIGALDTAIGAGNSYGLMAVFENTEKIFRTISFKVEEH